MNSNRGDQNAGDHAGAHLAGTSLTPTSKGPAASPKAASTATRRAVFDQMAQNYSESQAATSWVGDRYRKRDKSTPQGQKGDIMDCVTESGATTDDASLYSYHSGRDLSAFIKEFHGRIFNNQSELYVMPSDDAEFQRLAKQHYALVLGMDGLFPCAEIVHEILSKRDDHGRRQILDLGCGSGIWAIEMAIQFPECDVIGLDLAPPPVDLGTLPPNLRFEIDDINLGLSHYHGRSNGRFDIINVRCVGTGIAKYAKMMRDVEACLTPGGIVFFIDGDHMLYLEDMITPVAMGQEKEEGGDPNEGSWLFRIMREIWDAAVYNGCDVDGLENCIDEGLWGHELIDPATVRVATLCTPVGTWARARDPDTQQRLNYTGSLMRQDSMRASRGWHPMLRKYGIPQETLNKWSERIDAELINEKFRMCTRWRFTWGRRRLDDASNIPNAATGEDSSLGAGDAVAPAPAATLIPTRNSTDFKFMDICYTKEEAAAVMAVRRMKVRDLPETTVVKMRRPSD